MGAILGHYGLLLGGGGVSAFTLNPADKDSTLTLTNGNLTVSKGGGNSWCIVRATGGVSTGKWYWEVRQDTSMSNTREIAAITKSTVSVTGTQPGASTDGYGYNGINGFLYHSGSGAAYGSTFGLGDVIGIALDMTAGKIWFAVNNVWQASGNPGTGANPAASGIAAGTWFPTIGMWDNAGNAATARFKATDQTYAPPSGFTAIG